MLFMLAVVTPCMAQLEELGISLPGQGEEGPVDVPIDGFIGVAIAIGAAVGARRLRNKEK